MKQPFIRRPKAMAALTGLVVAVGLTVIPAQASSTSVYEKPSSTGTIGNGAAPGGPVTREQVIARAKDWVKEAVPYSMERWWKDDATGGFYRQDCSGFVSMAWQLKESHTTQTLPSVANRLAGFDQLEAGDALDYPDAHAVLFGGWTDKAKGDFVYYSESRPGRPARKESANIHDSKIANHPRTAYIPLRYKKLTTTQAPAPIPAKPTAPAQPAPTATAAPSTPAKPKAKPKPKPSTTAAPSPKASTAAPAAPSVTEPPASTAPSPAITAARPNTSAPPPSGGCTPTVRISFWNWLFGF
ncbi:hypothetical protein [Streptomyces sp. DSM 41634]|uniref:hypothetical protein n=1 Tax=Streptomyces sp. DSM 41634 TaxID=3448656 RepID=UPI0028835CF8|nr:hypothetical protein [Streptomyces sp. DSM 41633]